jgi:Anti-CBASS Acb1-like protein
MYNSGPEQSDTQSTVSVGGQLGSVLTNLLMCGDIVPGSPLGYDLAKQIHAYHTLGPVLADAPITRAQSKKREISVPVILGEKRIVEQFERTYREIGRVGATVVIHNLIKTSRIYGIASLAVGERGKPTDTPLDLAKISEADLFFNVLDPLNTAGSLVLEQDPNSPDFLKPSDTVHVQGQAWHHSRLFVKMHEQPIYIEWSASAFGFVGRSIYQRALFPLKSFVRTQIANEMIARKTGLIVAKMESPGSIIDNIMGAMFANKRAKIKEGMTNEVASIGTNESIETLNMSNIDKALTTARTNILKDIATSAGMPASIIAQETLTEGFGEGTEDMKKEIAYLNYIREDMQPAYDFVDKIVMRQAWTKEFYNSLKTDYPELKPYETWLYECIRAFSATWPNLMEEADSEKSKTEDVKMKSVIAVAEAVAPLCDPETKAKIVEWIADNVNNCENLFTGTLDVDREALQDYLEENAAQTQEAGSEEKAEKPEGRPHPFSVAS